MGYVSRETWVSRETLGLTSGSTQLKLADANFNFAHHSTEPAPNINGVEARSKFYIKLAAGSIKNLGNFEHHGSDASIEGF